MLISESFCTIPAMEIAELIRLARKKAGYSQRALADLMGVNKSAVAQWELGTTAPTAENMAALKLTLHIDTDSLVVEGRPYAGQLVEDRDELALIAFWRGLSPAKKDAVADLLRIGERRARKAV